ncbi:IS200/IS605 family transposase [Kitasatospora sp. NPDC004240]
MTKYQKLRTVLHPARPLRFRDRVPAQGVRRPTPDRPEEITRSARTDFEVEPVEFDGENDHAHPLVNLPPKTAPPKLVNSLKRAGSRRIRQEFPDPVKHHRRAQRLRSGPYVAGSAGGAPLSAVRRYIEQQNHPA